MHLDRQVAQREKQTITIYYIHACLFRYTSYSILLETSPKKAVCTSPLESTFLSLSVKAPPGVWKRMCVKAKSHVKRLLWI
jgi:hypothetical protein